MELMPGYKKEINKIIKFRKQVRDIDFIETNEEQKFTSMRSKAEIEDIEIDAVIDTGAAISAITRGLMEELGYKIDRSSDIVLVTANGDKSRSLGKIIDMELTLNGIETTVTVQVIESKDRVLILGNDWLKKVKANIDMENGKVNINGKKGYVNIPVEFVSLEQNENYDDEGYNSDYEQEELKEVRF
jgi:predicted aspartyl protease